MKEFVIFGGYFITIALLLTFTAPQWWSKTKWNLHHWLALAALLTTWERMFSYFRWSYQNFYASAPYLNSPHTASSPIAAWLSSTKLFKEAWSLVSSSPETWVISQRICFITILWTVFLHGHRQRVPHAWAYLLIGQLVAISVAMNLFFAALLAAEKDETVQSKPVTSPDTRGNLRRPPSTLLLQCVAIALASTLLVPTLPERYFLKNLLVLHGILIIPILVSETITRPPYYLKSVIQVLSALNSAWLIWQCHSLRAVYLAVASNPAMGSITFDVIMATLSIALWNAQRSGFGTRRLFALAGAPILQSSIESHAFARE